MKYILIGCDCVALHYIFSSLLVWTVKLPVAHQILVTWSICIQYCEKVSTPHKK